MISEEQKKRLVQAIMGYARKTRQSWGNLMGGIPGGERLTERDWTLMEWIAEKGEVQHSDAVQFAKGKDPSAGNSDQAITQAIGRMSKTLGVLRGQRTKADERKKTLTLTKKGEQLIERRKQIRAEMYDKIFETWEPLDDSDFCDKMTQMFLRGIANADKVFGNET